MNLSRLSLGLLVIIGHTACVSEGKYDRAVQDAHLAQQGQAKEAARAMATASELARQKEDTLAMAASLADEQTRLKAAQTKAMELQKALDEGTQSLDQAKRRLEELRKAQTAAEQRAALFRNLALKLRKMVDAGELKISLRDGRMVLQMPNEVLFDSGRTDLKPTGKKALAGIAQVLKTIDNRHFQVAGHTDNVPIQNSGFASNWELSCARALVVVHFLIEQGVSSELLSAAGYGEVDPVASNETPQNRQSNRRTEIVLQPNIDELVAVPEAR